MSFSIIRNLEKLPSYPILLKLAEQNHVCVTGNERTGSFSFRGIDVNYEFVEQGIRGKFAGHSITGEFSLETGTATVTVIEKPFFLPEMLLKQKIAQGVDTLWNKLASCGHPDGISNETPEAAAASPQTAS